jgi:acyl-CoA reductase-like NAD-dependent aldehyde dehydrogenase
MTPDEIAICFQGMAQDISRRRQDVLKILTAHELYKTAEVEIEKTIGALETYSEELKLLEHRVPLGKVAVFLPLNMPLYSMVLYSCGSLLAGNDVLLRPSTATAAAVQKIFELLNPSQYSLPWTLHVEPSGMFLQGCVKEKQVNCIVFTGRWESGLKLAESLSPAVNFIYSGPGVNPFIVLADADIEQAVDCAVYSRIFNSGQDCLCAEQFLIEAQIWEDFVGLLLEKVRRLKVGALDDPETDVGPLYLIPLADHVQQLITASGENIDWLLSAPIHPPLVPPLVCEVPIDRPLFKQEKFSPVFTLMRFTDLSVALNLVKESDYALGLTLFGGSQEILDDIEIGHIALNQSLLDVEGAHKPFGGYKRSGFVRNHGQTRYGPILFSVETSVTTAL